MPGGDRTGPLGFGPRTGRGLGCCSGYGRPGFVIPGGRYRYPSRGQGGRRGPGWKRGVCFWSGESLTDPSEKEFSRNR